MTDLSEIETTTMYDDERLDGTHQTLVTTNLLSPNVEHLDRQNTNVVLMREKT